MNSALMRKTFRDTWFVLLLAVVALVGFELIFVAAVGSQQMERQIRSTIPPWFRPVLSALVGGDIFSVMTPTGIMSISLVHPFLQLVLWAFTLSMCTRVISGEIDRGTADLLMSLPIRRSGMYLSFTAVWLLCGLILCAAPIAGLWLARRWYPAHPYDLGLLSVVVLNLFGMYLAVGAASLMFSAISSRRGRTVGIIAGLLLVSFALNFLVILWDSLRPLARFSVLEYYKPLMIILKQQWPVHDLKVLLAAAALFWTSGLLIFVRRDIRTG